MGIFSIQQDISITPRAIDDTDEGLKIVLEVKYVTTDGGFELDKPKVKTLRLSLNEETKV